MYSLGFIFCPLPRCSKTLSGMGGFRGCYPLSSLALLRGIPRLPLRHQRMLAISAKVDTAIAKVKVPDPQSCKVCSLYLSLSVTTSLPRRCDNGEPSSPDASGSATQRECMTRRGRLQESVAQCSLSLERQPRSSHMNNGLSEKTTARRTMPSYLPPCLTQWLQASDHQSPDGSWE